MRKAIRKDFVQLIGNLLQFIAELLQSCIYYNIVALFLDSVKSVVASSMNSYPHSMSEFKSLAAKIDASTNIIFECESY